MLRARLMLLAGKPVSLAQAVGECAGRTASKDIARQSDSSPCPTGGQVVAHSKSCQPDNGRGPVDSRSSDSRFCVRRLRGCGNTSSRGVFDVRLEVVVQHGAQPGMQHYLQERAGAGDLGPKPDGPVQLGVADGLRQRDLALVAGQRRPFNDAWPRGCRRPVRVSRDVNERGPSALVRS